MKTLGICKGISNLKGGAQSAAKKWFSTIVKVSHTSEIPIRVDTLDDSAAQSPMPIVSGSPIDFMKWYYLTSSLINSSYYNRHYDIHHIHCYNGYYTRPSNPCKTIITLHDEPFVQVNDNISPMYIRLIQEWIKRTARILKAKVLDQRPWVHALSNTVKQQLVDSGYDSDKIRVIPHGFPDPLSLRGELSRSDTLQRLGFPDSTRYVLVLGTIDYRKGSGRIVDMAQILQNEGSDIQVIMVGRADNFLQRGTSGVLFRRMRQLKLNNIHITGYLPKDLLLGLLNGCNAYLSASYSETGPLSLMEAAVVGVPIVATDVGVAREMFGDEIHLLSRNCSETDMKRAVTAACKQNKRTYQKAKHHSWEMVSKELLEFYYDITSG